MSISKDAVSHSVPPMTQAEESYKQALTNIREIINRANKEIDDFIPDDNKGRADVQIECNVYNCHIKAYDTIVAMMDAAGF